jgi:probable F420-dependent oxidoreductase
VSRRATHYPICARSSVRDGRGGAVRPRLVLILTENHTLVPARDLRRLVRMAVEAEEAGFDAVMVSEHVVLGPGADELGLPENPRDYALPGNQDPSKPWSDPLALLAAVAGVTTRLRLVASSIIAPLRHPLLLAKQLATLDLLSQGRLVVQPTVSWHRAEYEALGVPFEHRGELLDEHLAAWRTLWRETPASFEGRHYPFANVSLEPKPLREQGPTLWFGGQTMHDRLLRRLVEHGSGFNPLGSPSDEDLERLRSAMAAAGREMGEVEMVGGTRGRFAGPEGVADLGKALASIPAQLERGFTTICIKPSQFIDDHDEVAPFCRDVVERLEALVG